MRKFLIKSYHLKKTSLVQPLFMFIGVVLSFFSISQSEGSKPQNIKCNSVLVTPFEARQIVEREAGLFLEYFEIKKIYDIILQIYPLPPTAAQVTPKKVELAHIMNVLKESQNSKNQNNQSSFLTQMFDLIYKNNQNSLLAQILGKISPEENTKENIHFIETGIEILENLIPYEEELSNELNELKDNPIDPVWEVLVRKINELDRNFSNSKLSQKTLELWNFHIQAYNNANEMAKLLSELLLPPGVFFRTNIPDKALGDSVLLRVKFKHKNQEIEVDVIANIHSLMENLGKDKKDRYLVGKNALAALFFGHGGGSNTTNETVATEMLNQLSDLKIHVISMAFPWHGKGVRPDLLNVNLKDIISMIASFLKTFVHPLVGTFFAGHSWGALYAEAIRNIGSKADKFYNSNNINPLFLGFKQLILDNSLGSEKLKKRLIKEQKGETARFLGTIALSPVYNPFYNVHQLVQQSLNILFRSHHVGEKKITKRFNDQKNKNNPVPPEMFVAENLIPSGKISFLGGVVEYITYLQLQQKTFPHDNIPALNIVGMYDFLVFLGFDQLTIRMSIFGEITGLPIHSLIQKLQEEGYSGEQEISNLVMSDESFLRIIAKVTNKTLNELGKNGYTQERILAKGYEEYFKSQKNLIFILLKKLRLKKNPTDVRDVQHMLSNYIADAEIKGVLDRHIMEFLTHHLRDNKYKNLFENREYHEGTAFSLAKAYVEKYSISPGNTESVDLYASRHFMRIMLGIKLEKQTTPERQKKPDKRTTNTLAEFIQHWIMYPEFAKWVERFIILPEEKSLIKEKRAKQALKLEKSIMEIIKKNSPQKRIERLIEQVKSSTEFSTLLELLRSEIPRLNSLLEDENILDTEMEKIKDNETEKTRYQSLESYKLFVKNLKKLQLDLENPLTNPKNLKALKDLSSKALEEFKNIKIDRRRSIKSINQMLLESVYPSIQGHIVYNRMSLLKWVESELTIYYTDGSNNPDTLNTSNFKNYIENKLENDLNPGEEEKLNTLRNLIGEFVDLLLSEYYIPTKEEIRKKIDNYKQDKKIKSGGLYSMSTNELTSTIHSEIQNNVIERVKIKREIIENEKLRDKLINGIDNVSYEELKEKVNKNIKIVQKELDIYRFENPSEYPVELHEDIEKLNQANKVFVAKSNGYIKNVEEISARIVTDQQKENKSEGEKEKIRNDTSSEIMLEWENFLQAQREYFKTRRAVIKNFIIIFREVAKFDSEKLKDLRVAIVSFYGSKNQNKKSDYKEYIRLTEEINDLEHKIEDSNQKYFESLLNKYAVLDTLRDNNQVHDLNFLNWRDPDLEDPYSSFTTPLETIKSILELVNKNNENEAKAEAELKKLIQIINKLIKKYKEEYVASYPSSLPHLFEDILSEI